jgi:peptidoglycan hydrolase-like protein with peptidoglycan-binding domain
MPGTFPSARTARPTGLRAVALLVPVLVLALAGCGASSPATSGQSATTTTAAGPSPSLGPDVVVTYLQSALTQLGYLDTADGIWGPKTAQALTAFQKAVGLPANGQLDAKTALALADRSTGSRMYLVMALQTQLTELGLYSGTIDGHWTPAVVDAVKRLQRSAGLAVDGVVGPATLAALDQRYRADVVVPEQKADHYIPAVTGVTSTTTTTTTAAASTTTAVPAGTTSTAPAGGAPSSAQIADVQRQLAALGYRPGAATGRPDAQTNSAVLAYQKRNGLPRDSSIGPQVIGRLAQPQAAGPRSTAPGPRVEIDLDRQIIFYIAADGAVTTLNTSTGNGETYREPSGGTAVAYTPTGQFTVQRKVAGNEKAPLGTLYYPMYFTGGWAIHGSPSVPAYPASHGCARVANWDQDYLFPKLPVGSPVWVYGTSRGSPKGAEPGF